jgi:hypothetical protein
MKTLEAIEIRKSVRQYIDKSLESSVLEAVETLLKNSPTGPFGTKPKLQIIETQNPKALEEKSFASYGLIKGAHHYMAAAIVNGRQENLDLGYLLEKVVIDLTKMDLGTCWLGGTFKRDRIQSLFAAEYTLAENEMIRILMPFGRGTAEKSFLEKAVKFMSQSHKRKPWDQLFFALDTGSPLVAKGDKWWAKALEAVQIAPSAVNLQPWRIFVSEDHKSFQFHIQGTSYIDLGIAMAHFDLIAEEEGIKVVWQVEEDVKVQAGLEYVVTGVCEG